MGCQCFIILASVCHACVMRHIAMTMHMYDLTAAYATMMGDGGSHIVICHSTEPRATHGLCDNISHVLSNLSLPSHPSPNLRSSPPLLFSPLPTASPCIYPPTRPTPATGKVNFPISDYVPDHYLAAGVAVPEEVAQRASEIEKARALRAAEEAAAAPAGGSALDGALSEESEDDLGAEGMEGLSSAVRRVRKRKRRAAQANILVRGGALDALMTDDDEDDEDGEGSRGARGAESDGSGSGAAGARGGKRARGDGEDDGDGDGEGDGEGRASDAGGQGRGWGGSPLQVGSQEEPAAAGAGGTMAMSPMTTPMAALMLQHVGSEDLAAMQALTELGDASLFGGRRGGSATDNGGGYGASASAPTLRPPALMAPLGRGGSGGGTLGRGQGASLRAQQPRDSQGRFMSVGGGSGGKSRGGGGRSGRARAQAPARDQRERHQQYAPLPPQYGVYGGGDALAGGGMRGGWEGPGPLGGAGQAPWLDPMQRQQRPGLAQQLGALGAPPAGGAGAGAGASGLLEQLARAVIAAQAGEPSAGHSAATAMTNDPLAAAGAPPAQPDLRQALEALIGCTAPDMRAPAAAPRARMDAALAELLARLAQHEQQQQQAPQQPQPQPLQQQHPLLAALEAARASQSPSPAARLLEAVGGPELLQRLLQAASGAAPGAATGGSGLAQRLTQTGAAPRDSPDAAANLLLPLLSQPERPPPAAGLPSAHYSPGGSQRVITSPPPSSPRSTLSKLLENLVHGGSNPQQSSHSLSSSLTASHGHGLSRADPSVSALSGGSSGIAHRHPVALRAAAAPPQSPARETTSSTTSTDSLITALASTLARSSSGGAGGGSGAAGALLQQLQELHQQRLREGQRVGEPAAVVAPQQRDVEGIEQVQSAVVATLMAVLQREREQREQTEQQAPALNAEWQQEGPAGAAAPKGEASRALLAPAPPVPLLEAPPQQVTNEQGAGTHLPPVSDFAAAQQRRAEGGEFTAMLLDSPHKKQAPAGRDAAPPPAPAAAAPAAAPKEEDVVRGAAGPLMLPPAAADQQEHKAAQQATRQPQRVPQHAQHAQQQANQQQANTQQASQQQQQPLQRLQVPVIMLDSTDVSESDLGPSGQQPLISSDLKQRLRALALRKSAALGLPQSGGGSPGAGGRVVVMVAPVIVRVGERGDDAQRGAIAPAPSGAVGEGGAGDAVRGVGGQQVVQANGGLQGVGDEGGHRGGSSGGEDGGRGARGEQPAAERREAAAAGAGAGAGRAGNQGAVGAALGNDGGAGGDAGDAPDGAGYGALPDSPGYMPPGTPTYELPAAMGEDGNQGVGAVGQEHEDGLLMQFL